jgi:metal-responsive CopG/Arc/MetJ family transcriptional regulator
MATISIRIQDEILAELDEKSQALHMPRAEYVRQAVIAMNMQVEKDLRKKRIMDAARRVREESMRVNAEFDAVEECPDV